MKNTIYLLIFTFTLVNCSRSAIEQELVNENNRLETINDSLTRIIENSKKLYEARYLNIIPYSHFIASGDSMKYLINFSVINKEEKNPYLYYSDSSELEDGFPTRLLGNIDSVEMINWEARIYVPQNKLGRKTTYFFAKVPNYQGRLMDYPAYHEYLVIPPPDLKKIIEIIENK